MKLYKYTLYMLIMITFMIFLNGCHSEYPIEVTVNGDMSDRKIDILIPLDKDSPDFQDSIYIQNDSVQESEIVDYSVDGYRSMIYHYRLSDYSMEKTDDSTYTAQLYLNGKREFKKICDNYKTFKIAVIDNDGNLLKVSEECSFKLSEKVFLDKIEYDYFTNTISPEYEYNRSLGVIFIEFIAGLLSTIMPVLSLMLFIILIIKKLEGSLDFPETCHNIIFFMFIIPFDLFFGLRIEYAVRTKRPLSSVWGDLAKYDLAEYSDVFSVIYQFIPQIILLVVLVWTLFGKAKACNFSEDDV